MLLGCNMGVETTYKRIIQRQGREVTLRRIRSAPMNEVLTFVACSRDFRTNKVEKLLGEMTQQMQEFWTLNNFGEAPPKPRDRLVDGDLVYTIVEVNQLFGPTSCGLRFFCVGQDDG